MLRGMKKQVSNEKIHLNINDNLSEITIYAPERQQEKTRKLAPSYNTNPEAKLL
jgi:hypothetical protein